MILPSRTARCLSGEVLFGFHHGSGVGPTHVCASSKSPHCVDDCVHHAKLVAVDWEVTNVTRYQASLRKLAMETCLARFVFANQRDQESWAHFWNDDKLGWVWGARQKHMYKVVSLHGRWPHHFFAKSHSHPCTDSPSSSDHVLSYYVAARHFQRSWP